MRYLFLYKENIFIILKKFPFSIFLPPLRGIFYLCYFYSVKKGGKTMATIKMNESSLFHELNEKYHQIVKEEYELEQELKMIEKGDYIKEGYLQIPYIKYTNQHREVVLQVLRKQCLDLCERKIYRRKDIIDSVLEVNG